MPLIKGTILHDSFEDALRKNDFSRSNMERTLKQRINDNIDKFYAVGETNESAEDQLQVFIPKMQEWAKKFLHYEPKVCCAFHHLESESIWF